MKADYPGWYVRTPDEIAALWDKAIFVPDANILLHCLRHRADVRVELFRVLDVLKERLWMPHQVGLEFHRNRLEVEVAARDAYDKVIGDREKTTREAKDKLLQLRAHPVINVDSETQLLDDALEQFKTRMLAAKQAHPERELAKGTDQLTAVFAGRVGKPWPDDKLAALKKEGDERYIKKIPPGFKDQPKDANEMAKFGDLIIWKDLIAKAKSDKRPVIFITDDVKEDWWRIHKGKKYGPRPELVEEFLSESGQQFHIYELMQFLRFAVNHHPEIPATSIENIARSVNDDERARLSQEQARTAARLCVARDDYEMERDQILAELAGLGRAGELRVGVALDRGTHLARLAALDTEIAAINADLELLSSH